ncbi:MAG: hypothetical protein DSY70_06590 [Desulfobulbus sp.]|nr:MAG: hypothetical protein DSY70_06590 [Desulfobulbus sp.]
MINTFLDCQLGALCMPIKSNVSKRKLPRWATGIWPKNSQEVKFICRDWINIRSYDVSVKRQCQANIAECGDIPQYQMSRFCDNKEDEDILLPTSY